MMPDYGEIVRNEGTDEHAIDGAVTRQTESKIQLQKILWTLGLLGLNDVPQVPIHVEYTSHKYRSNAQFLMLLMEKA